MEKEWVRMRGIRIGNLKANCFHAREKLSVGIAKKVDGLHGVADGEAGAASALGPRSDNAGQQPVLSPACVLELVYQQVTNTIGNGERSIGRQAIFAGEHALGNLRNFNKVRRASLGKHHLQLGCRVSQQVETGAHDLPVILGVAGGRQAGDRREGGFEAENGFELFDKVEQSALFAFAIGWETEADVDLLAERTVASEQQISKAEVGSASFFQSLDPCERRAGKLGKLGEVPVELAAALAAGKPRQFQGFLAGMGNLIEELA
jgi:hypothetical protein